MSNDTTESVTSVTNGESSQDDRDVSIETIVVDPDATVVELTACRLRVIEGLEDLNKVETLNFRQNLIERITNISQLTTLQHLDLYDNHIERIEGLAELVHLKHLDLSFSKWSADSYRESVQYWSYLDKISVIENLSTLINLEALFIVHNQIRTVENLSTLVKLRVLELGDNRIKVSGSSMFGLERSQNIVILF